MTISHLSLSLSLFDHPFLVLRQQMITIRGTIPWKICAWQWCFMSAEDQNLTLLNLHVLLLQLSSEWKPEATSFSLQASCRIHCLTVLEATHLESRCHQGHASPESIREESLLSPPPSGGSRPSLACGNMVLVSASVFAWPSSPCGCVSVSFPL